MGRPWRALAILGIINFLWLSPAVAETGHSPDFPVLGTVVGKLLYVPTYKKEHGKIPAELFAYGGGKEFSARLRKNDPFIALDDRRDCYASWLGQYVYELEAAPAADKVIVFDGKRDIRFAEKVMSEPATHTAWDIRQLTSHEGVHDLLLTLREGKCVSHVDYYMHCNYDTEPDSDQAFAEAMCGERIEESNTGF